ncbi:hypothetical protein H2O64_05615 [Kordia sp. YSTF-M3]|uniref:Bacteriocin n=1 Tax=Kordia aestuariivivens TaxID=2759037 RepID=A0ABR7Q6E3_9FLAO|nr:hypothetical protein [Kordia aestuariivivens]MBC8754139.1 hypothetical protein [Kordia aestuariivivens]
MKNNSAKQRNLGKLNFKQVTISSLSKQEIKGGGAWTIPKPSTAGTQSWCICQ